MAKLTNDQAEYWMQLARPWFSGRFAISIAIFVLLGVGQATHDDRGPNALERAIACSALVFGVGWWIAKAGFWLYDSKKPQSTTLRSPSRSRHNSRHGIIREKSR
jgi:hypothetical protein